MKRMQKSLFNDTNFDFQPPKAAIDKRLTHWAVKEAAAPVVWGVGETRNKAVADALNQFVDQELLDIKIISDVHSEIAGGYLTLIRCSRRLFIDVKAYGGEVELFDPDGQGIFLLSEILGR